MASPSYRLAATRPGIAAQRLHARRPLHAGIRQGRRGARPLGRALHHRRVRLGALLPASGTPDHRRWYDDAREFARIVSLEGGALLSEQKSARQRHRHRRRPGHHGSRQPRRARCRRADHRLQHHPADGAGTERLFHAGPHLPLPLFRDAQDALRHARQRAGRLPRRPRHVRRTVRTARPAPDGQVAADPDRALRPQVLGRSRQLRRAGEARRHRQGGRDAVHLRRDAGGGVEPVRERRRADALAAGTAHDLMRQENRPWNSGRA